MYFDMLFYVIQQAIVSMYLLNNFLNSFRFMLKVFLQACFVSLKGAIPLGTVNYLLYRVILSLEAPNYCLCIQSNSAGFSFINAGKQVHLKHARRHFERNLVKDVHHRSVASRNWLKS